jgi:DNA-binding transcriptional LysR family regulator
MPTRKPARPSRLSRRRARAQLHSGCRAAWRRRAVSQSTLSHTIKALEERLGVRLLTRTTRSVSPTEAGERLIQGIAPHFEEIEAELAAVGELRDKPAGTIRITATDYAANTIIWPRSRRSCRTTRSFASRSPSTTRCATSSRTASTSGCAPATRWRRT